MGSKIKNGEAHPPTWPFPTYKGQPYRPPRKRRAPPAKPMPSTPF